MKDDNEQILVDFHTRANTLFQNHYASFEEAVKHVNRQSDEHKFTAYKNQYINTLKQQLESCAALLMQEHSHNRKQQDLDQNLQHHIQQYLHLFVQKIRDV